MLNGHAVDLAWKRHHDELRAMWQGKLLLHVHEKSDRKLAAVVLSMIAHAYPFDAMVTLMKVCFPGFQNIRPPFYASAGKIMKGGEIAADLRQRDGTTVRNTFVFNSLTEYESAMRTLADELVLSDDDRVAFFAIVKKWIVADFRLDPNRTEAA